VDVHFEARIAGLRKFKTHMSELRIGLHERRYRALQVARRPRTQDDASDSRRRNAEKMQAAIDPMGMRLQIVKR